MSDHQKQIAGEAAALIVEGGMTVGLGTGSTAAWFVKALGARANLGAGTIFCNYDGFDKFETHVGADAFIGSDTALVAPVTVGDGAFTGSGSVITQDVPANALALGRGRQVIKEGWAEAFRAHKKANRKPK